MSITRACRIVASVVVGPDSDQEIQNAKLEKTGETEGLVGPLCQMLASRLFVFLG